MNIQIFITYGALGAVIPDALFIFIETIIILSFFVHKIDRVMWMDFGKRAGKIFKSLLLIIVVFICFFCLNNERQEELEMQMMEFVNPFCGYIESPKTKVCSEAFLDKMNFFVVGLLG